MQRNCSGDADSTKPHACPGLCKCSFHESCSSIFASVHFARLGKIRVVLRLFARRICRKQARGIRDWKRSRKVVQETGERAAANGRQHRGSRCKEHTRCYHISNQESRISYFLGVRTRMCYGVFERGGRSIGRLAKRSNYAHSCWDKRSR
jgi:hypothetical protein